MQRWAKQAVLTILFSLFGANMGFAITPPVIPGSAEPGVISKTLTQQLPTAASTVKPTGPITQQKEVVGSLGPQAEKIKFKLTQIVLDGNHTYSEKELASLYKSKVNTSISVAELMDIVQSITNYYRNNGYILSRAILPPQHVANGVVHIRILEGFIDEVKIIGKAKGAKAVIQRYIGKITQSRPLQIRVLEYYLRLANSIPGVHVKSVLEPSKTTLAASTLNIVADTQTLSGYVSYDNYGSRFIGPNEVTLSATANSIFLSGDTTRLSYITTSRPKQLKYRDISYTALIGSRGLAFTADANQSNTRPGLNLAALKTNGLSNSYDGQFSYPLILSRESDLTLNGIFNYVDTGVTIFGQRLYLDHIRNINIGGVYNLADSYKGTNNLTGTIEKGVPWFGATTNPASRSTSRFGATSKYLKFNLQASRIQQFGATRYSAMLLGKGQYSCQPLLATAQFPFGGAQVGRGYDSADIIGDLGAGGTLELRMDLMPGWRFLQYLQPYVFYDGGVIWNRKNIPGTKTKQSETSTGVGIRFVFTQHIVGNLILAQPLTKQDIAEETSTNGTLSRNGRAPRGWFSITVTT